MQLHHANEKHPLDLEGSNSVIHYSIGGKPVGRGDLRQHLKGLMKPIQKAASRYGRSFNNIDNRIRYLPNWSINFIKGIGSDILSQAMHLEGRKVPTFVAVPFIPIFKIPRRRWTTPLLAICTGKEVFVFDPMDTTARFKVNGEIEPYINIEVIPFSRTIYDDIDEAKPKKQQGEVIIDLTVKKKHTMAVDFTGAMFNMGNYFGSNFVNPEDFLSRVYYCKGEYEKAHQVTRFITNQIRHEVNDKLREVAVKATHLEGKLMPQPPALITDTTEPMLQALSHDNPFLKDSVESAVDALMDRIECYEPNLTTDTAMQILNGIADRCFKKFQEAGPLSTEEFQKRIQEKANDYVKNAATFYNERNKDNQ